MEDLIGRRLVAPALGGVGWFPLSEVAELGLCMLLLACAGLPTIGFPVTPMFAVADCGLTGLFVASPSAEVLLLRLCIAEAGLLLFGMKSGGKSPKQEWVPIGTRPRAFSLCRLLDPSR